MEQDDLVPQTHQENFLMLLAMSDEHGRLVAAQLRPEHFEGDYQMFAMRLFEFWKKYGEAPKTATIDQFANELEDPKRQGLAKTIRRINLNIHNLWSHEPNTTVILDQLYAFKEVQTYKRGIMEMADAAAVGNIIKVRELAFKMQNAQVTKFDPGLNPASVSTFLEQLDVSSQDEFLTGIKELNDRHVVPGRGKLMMFLGVTGAGKTWWLINLGHQATILRKKVLHITLELSAAETNKRYWQMSMSVPLWDRHLETTTASITPDDDGYYKYHRQITKKAKFSLQRPQYKKIASHGKQHKAELDYIRIKQFPTRAFTVSDLDAEMHIQKSVGFHPDMLIIDYAALMKTDADNYRISLGRLLEDLRGFAVKYNIALVTAHQISRQGFKSQHTTMGHIAEDWSIAQTSDIIIALTRAEDEKKAKMARLWVEKNRSGDEGFGVVIAQNYEHGQFFIDSSALYSKETYDTQFSSHGKRSKRADEDDGGSIDD